MIINYREADLDHISDITLIHRFIDEFFYWNPFIKKVWYQFKSFENKKPVDIVKVSILDIRVEQLTVSKTKLDQVLKWVNNEEDIIINVVDIN